ncbi:type VI secretion system tip protein VgrG, partial [bacterium]|nr:type VI secretion system tip protein VgrG [bacterium]
VTDLLTELGMVDFKDETRQKYPKRDYVTQYAETYRDLVVRLLQSEFIIWRFEHTKDKHTLVLSDDSTALPEIPTSLWTGVDSFKSFCLKNSLVPIDGCQTAAFDYDNQPVKRVGKPEVSTGESLRRFEYPGDFIAREDGENKMKRRQVTVKSEELQYQGTSSIRMLEAGKRFTLLAPTLPEFHDQPFLIKDLTIEASAKSYLNSFIALPAKTPFYFSDADRIAKPQIAGNQTAVVVGTKNASDIKVDNQGRVMVRFHWDHHSPADTGSAFIRNAMPAAGARRGFIFNPNIGDEVVVAFEDGDPDKPIIIGRAYASNQRAAVSPEKTPEQSVIQPKEYNGANRILFDDKKGSENLEFRAKKDMNIKVGTDLNIDINDDLTILADNLEVTANGNILTGNIITLSGGEISSTAGGKISNMTGLIVANIVGGIEQNKAGSNAINIALGKVDSRSGGHTLSAAPTIFNTTAGSVELNGKGGVTNLGLIVANTAMELIENSSSGNVKQEAGLAIITNTKTEGNTFSDGSKTEALMVKDKGKMVINE